MRSLSRPIVAGYAWLAFAVFTLAWAGINVGGLLSGSDPGPIGVIGAGVGLYIVIVMLLIASHWIRFGADESPRDILVFGAPISELVLRAGIATVERLMMVVGVAGLLVTSGAVFAWLLVLVALLAHTSLTGQAERNDVEWPRELIPLPPLPVQPTSGVTRNTWTWDNATTDEQCSVTLSIRNEISDARAASNRTRGGMPVADWHLAARELVEVGSSDAEVAEGARQLLAWSRGRHFSYYDEACNALQFVQTIPYKSDIETKNAIDYWRFPIETLRDDAGDCDCKAILAASLFRQMGLRCVVLGSPDEEHAAVGVEGAPDYPGHRYFVHGGYRYFFCETTSGPQGFRVGEVPPDVDVNRYQVRVEIEPALLQATAP